MLIGPDAVEPGIGQPQRSACPGRPGPERGRWVDWAIAAPLLATNPRHRLRSTRTFCASRLSPQADGSVLKRGQAHANAFRFQHARPPRLRPSAPPGVPCKRVRMTITREGKKARGPKGKPPGPSQADASGGRTSPSKSDALAHEFQMTKFLMGRPASARLRPKRPATTMTGK